MEKLFSRIFVISSLALASVLVPLATPVAHAEHEIGTPFTGTRPYQLDVHSGFSWDGFGFNAGARFGIPLLHNGPISTIDNAFYLNVGFEFYYSDEGWDPAERHYYAAFGVPITLHWEFFFNDTWSVFAELGLQVYFPPSFVHNDGHGNYAVDAGGWVIALAGGTLHFNEVIGLTLRVGNPYVAIGLTFTF